MSKNHGHPVFHPGAKRATVKELPSHDAFEYLDGSSPLRSPIVLRTLEDAVPAVARATNKPGPASKRHRMGSQPDA